VAPRLEHGNEQSLSDSGSDQIRPASDGSSDLQVILEILKIKPACEKKAFRRGGSDTDKVREVQEEEDQR
jgi:hypothetical protein